MANGIKAGDLKKCALCGRGVAADGSILFFQVEVQRFGLDLKAVQRVHGMEQYFGGTPGAAVAIARVFEDPEVAIPVGYPTKVLVCDPCALNPRPHALAILLEGEATKQSAERDEYPARPASF